LSGETRPLNWTFTLGLPRRLTWPSMSTSSSGTLRSTSAALPVVALGMSFAR